MSDITPLTESAYDGLAWRDWLAEIDSRIDTETGAYLKRLGADHAAMFTPGNQTLLVSFEAHHCLEDVSERAHPLGWEMVKALGWSHLCLLSEADTWFRATQVYGFVDQLIDDGFFEAYDSVVFYGAGSCGYAAAAFSVASPGARVLALQPQASLDPRVAEWDDRFVSMRRTSFQDRYGYAPDMLDAATEAFVLYDPEVELDAMHAALFTRPNVTKFRMRHLSPRLDASLMQMNVLLRCLAQLSAGKLTLTSLAKLYRARHDMTGYQYKLLRAVVRDNRHLMTRWLAESVLARREAPPFRKALARANNIMDARARKAAAAQSD